MSGSCLITGDSLQYENGQAFTTKDRDNGPHVINCAIYSHGAWWYKNCSSSNLNGLYLGGGKIDDKGISWFYFKSNYYSMKSSSMMIRRLY